MKKGKYLIFIECFGGWGSGFDFVDLTSLRSYYYTTVILPEFIKQKFKIIKNFAFKVEENFNKPKKKKYLNIEKKILRFYECKMNFYPYEKIPKEILSKIVLNLFEV